jgi:hypothetical protein
VTISWDHVRTASSIFSLIGVGFAVAFYFADIKHRLDTLEKQVMVLAGPSKSSDPERAKTEPPRVSPLVETCQQLYKQSVQQATVTGDYGVTARSHLQSLGCDAILKEVGK